MRVQTPSWLAMSCSLLLLMPLVAAAGSFRLQSRDLAAEKPIASQFVYNRSGCKGGDHSPALNWSGAPAGTRSFVVTVHDPDATRGWWHWAVANIPASLHHLGRDAGAAGGSALPSGAVQLTNDFGKSSYSGPCPPPGDAPHHYHFRVYALDVARLPVSASDSPAKLKALLAKHRLGVAQLVRRYGR